MQLDHPHRGDLAAAEAGCEFTHEHGNRGRAVAGVVTQVHRGGPGVVRLPGNHDLLPGNSLQVLDHTDGQGVCLQHRSLLDM